MKAKEKKNIKDKAELERSRSALSYNFEKVCKSQVRGSEKEGWKRESRKDCGQPVKARYTNGLSDFPRLLFIFQQDRPPISPVFLNSAYVGGLSVSTSHFLNSGRLIFVLLSIL